MKKIFLFFMILFCFCFTAQAEEPVSYVYSTDIVAYVNGYAIPSYNIGGKTVIIAEDFENYIGEISYDYGFDVMYNDDERTLTIDSSGFMPYNTPEVKKGTLGEIVGQVYKSDIKVLFNSFEVTGYNIGGKTAICIEEIGVFDEESPNFEYGYSKYMCNSVWNAEKRSITLNTYQKKNYDSFENIPLKKLVFKYTDNRLTVEFNQENRYFNSSVYDFSDGFTADSYKIKDVYYGESNEKIGTMYLDSNGHIYSRFDYEKLENLTKDIAEVLSYEDAKKYAENNYIILNTYENEISTVYFAQREDTKYLLLAIKKGGFVVADVYPPNYTEVEMFTYEFRPLEVEVKVYPFGGPHGATEAWFVYDTDYYTFE